MSVRRTFRRMRAIVGLGIAQLRHSSGRTVLAVGGVMLAVLSITLLAGLGIGVVETGQETFDESGRDIWITGGPGADSPTTTENEVVDAPAIAAEIREHDDVPSGDVSTIAMHDLYVGSTPAEAERVPAVGIQGTHGHFEFEAGQGFAGAAYDGHADEGREDQPSNVTVIDPKLADRFGINVGDTVYVGASEQRTEPYTVVGIGSYYSQFLGTETVTMPLDELQVMTGSAGSNRAAFVTVNVDDDADRETIRDELQATYPEYDVRTSDDQFAALVSDRILMVASGMVLVGLAIAGGVTLTANLFVLVTYHQRETLAALRALGLSRWLLAGIIGVQGTIIGFLGGVLGLAATPLLVYGLNHLSEVILGFERIVRTTVEVYALGFATALVVGTVVAIVTGWQASRFATFKTIGS